MKSIRGLSISAMDEAALIALYSTLTPGYIIAALPVTIIVNELLRPVLKNYGHAGAYPFLPVAFAVNLLAIFMVMSGGMESYVL